MNQYQAWQVFTNKAMRVLKNKLVFLKGVNRDNQHLFAAPGKKPGEQINIRLPGRYKGRVGEVYSPEPFKQTSIPVNIRPLQGMDIDLPSTDITLWINNIKDDVLEPALAQLVNNVERDCMQIAYQSTANYSGVIGSAASTATTVLQAGAYITNEGGPDDDTRRMLLSVNTNVSLVPAFAGLFNPQQKIGGQFERGLIGKAVLGFDHFQTPNVYQHQVGLLGGTPAVHGANQSGNSLITNGWTANRQVLNKGDVIQCAATNAVNPMTREVYGGLRNLAVTAPVFSDGSGNATIPFSCGPYGIVAAPDAFATVDALPADGALISVFGVAAAGQSAIASQYSAQCLGYHKDAFTFAGISQELPKGSADIAYEATDPDTGIQLRFARQWQGKENVFINRFDVLYAFGAPYSNLAVRMLSL